jgi:hypothetical protein
MPHRGHGTRGSRQKDALIDGLNREFVEKLATDVESATTEHGFGLAGGEPLNKNSDGDVTTIVTNSPGAVAAAAGRDVHQKVQHQTYATLIQSWTRFWCPMNFSGWSKSIRKRWAILPRPFVRLRAKSSLIRKRLRVEVSV